MTPTTEYTVDYFIAKFEAIPEEKWCTDEYVKGDCCCALGYCGERDGYVTAESEALQGLFKRSLGWLVPNINDRLGYGGDRYPQPTPKQRILAALRDIKSKQESEAAHG